jgi:two-component sensor histidine kinase
MMLELQEKERSGYPVGGGRIGEFIRSREWSQTTIGPIETWPQSLKTALDVVLGSRTPAALLWQDCVHFYNDAFASTVDERHPATLGPCSLTKFGVDHLVARSELERVKLGESVLIAGIERAETSMRSRLCSSRTCLPIHGESGQVAGLMLLDIGAGAPVEARPPPHAPDIDQAALDEMRNRGRNLLARIRSIIARTAAAYDSTESFAAHLEGRLGALGRAEASLGRAAGAGVDLELLVREELLALAAPDDRVRVEGPSVRLAAKAAEIMTLVAHELASNAMKFGALGQGSGRIAIQWCVRGEMAARRLYLSWSESGVPVVSPAPRREGFGYELIAMRIPYELGGRGELNLAPGGVDCRIEIPLEPLGGAHGPL